MKIGESSFKGPQIRGLCLTENIFIYSDRENFEGIVIVFKRKEEQLQQILKITGLMTPRGVAVDSEGKHIYVVESENNRVLKFDIIQRTCVRQSQSPVSEKFILPRGIIAKNKWIFVCDTGQNEIKILDEDLTFRFNMSNMFGVLSSPNDIACLYMSDECYTLFIANNNGTIAILEAHLNDQASYTHNDSLKTGYGM